MGRLPFILTLSLVLTIFVGAVLTRQSRAWRTKGRRSSGDDSGTKVGEMAPTFKLMSVGFAEEKGGTAKIVVSAVVAHEKYIGTRASQYARMAMKQYFGNYFANKHKKL